MHEQARPQRCGHTAEGLLLAQHLLPRTFCSLWSLEVNWMTGTLLHLLRLGVGLVPGAVWFKFLTGRHEDGCLQEGGARG